MKDFKVKYLKEHKRHYIFYKGEMYGGLAWGFETKRDAKDFIATIKAFADAGRMEI